MSSPMSPRFGRRPAATSSLSARAASDRPGSTVNCPSAYATSLILAPTSTWMPSRANTSVTSLLDSGSSSARIRSATSRMVTCTPNRENACAISTPIAPAADHDQAGSAASLSCTASRLVQYGVSARPGIGGTPGSVPVLSTTPRLATNVSSPTSTVRSPASWPCPRTNVAPLSTSRSTATWSFQSSVASDRDPLGDLRPVGSAPHSCPQGRGSAGPRPAHRRRGSSSCSGRTRSRGTRRRPGADRLRPRPGRPWPAGRRRTLRQARARSRRRRLRWP